MDREKLPRLKYPTYELFKLGKGEEYLANTIKFYGEDLSAYITYCSFTNQFINCNLSKIDNKMIPLFFEEGKVQKQLTYYFIKYFGGEEGGHALWKEWRNFYMVYQCFREDLFQNFNLKYRKDETSKYKKLKSFEISFEIQLLKFVESMYYGFNFKNKDIEYSRGEYFLDCISISQRINIEENNYTKEYKNKIKFYQILGYFRDKIINSTKHYTSDKLSYDYLDNNMPDNWFTAKDEMMFDTLLRLLLNDEFLSNNIFIFKRNLNKNSFYKRLIEDFFDSSSTKLPTIKDANKTRKNVKRINKIKLLPLNPTINLIEPPEYLYMDELENAYIEFMGGVEAYEKYQKELDQLLREY